MRKVKSLLLVALCVASVSAQGIKVTAPKVTVTAPAVAVPEAPAAPAAPAVPTAPAAPAAPTMPTVAAPAAPAHPPVPVITEHTVADSPIIDSALVQKVEEVLPEPKPEPKVEPAPVPAPVVVPPVVAKEPSNLKFHLGSRAGVGISALRGHVALAVEKQLGKNSYTDVPVELKSAFSLGLGMELAIEISSSFTLAPELQYTLYRANGATRQGDDGVPYQEEAGVRLHSFELPIIARFSLGSDLYAELGPQFGYNAEATSYKNDDSRKLQVNKFAFGPAIGFGVKIDEVLLGIRGYLGVLEYADNTNGKPWALQISATKFFF